MKVLSQTDITRLLLKDPLLSQDQAYSIFRAYAYCKSSRGSLPSETLTKVYMILTRVRTANPLVNSSHPISRAFDALRVQLALVSRRFILDGVSAYGIIGEIGSAYHPAAIEAWTKATGGRITKFDTGDQIRTIAVDAGRVLISGINDLPPTYLPAQSDQPLVAESVPTVALPTIDIEAGRAGLAALKAQIEQRKRTTAMEGETVPHEPSVAV